MVDVGSEVWVLDINAEGPQGGDYTGLRSVHATKDGALHRLFDWIHAEMHVDPRSDAVQVVTSAEQDNGSVAADLVIVQDNAFSLGWKISYGVHRHPVGF